MIRRGDFVTILQGPYRGLGGKVRKRMKDGRVLLNLNVRQGLCTCTYVRPGQLRRVCHGTPKSANGK
jgi:hypothetical protein